MNAVVLKQFKDHEIVMEWSSSAVNDMIADALLALLNGIDMSPASVKCPFENHTFVQLTLLFQTLRRVILIHTRIKTAKSYALNVFACSSMPILEM